MVSTLFGMQKKVDGAFWKIQCGHEAQQAWTFAVYEEKTWQAHALRSETCLQCSGSCSELYIESAKYNGFRICTFSAMMAMGLLTWSCCVCSTLLNYGHLRTFFGLHFQHTGPWIKLSRAAGLNQPLTLASISEKSCQSQWCRQAIHHSSLQLIPSCRRCQRIGRHRLGQSHPSEAGLEISSKSHGTPNPERDSELSLAICELLWSTLVVFREMVVVRQQLCLQLSLHLWRCLNCGVASFGSDSFSASDLVLWLKQWLLQPVLLEMWYRIEAAKTCGLW